MDKELQRMREVVEKKERWYRHIEDIPYLNFPIVWNVKIIPPFGGALVRFLIMYNNKEITIKLSDLGYDMFYRGLVWEVHGLNKNLTFKLGKSKEMLATITKALS